MQDFSLNSEFFQENFAECGKRVHPINFLQDFFHAEESQFNKTFSPENLQEIIQSILHSQIDPELLEELFDRVRFEKKKPLTLNEFFKVFHEAETVLLLKAEYMRFLLEQNGEILGKVQEIIEDLQLSPLLKNSESGEKNMRNSRKNSTEKKRNSIIIEFERLIGDNDDHFIAVLNYGDYKYKTKCEVENGVFNEKPLQIPIKDLEELLEFSVFRVSDSDEILLGKAKLSLFYVNFSKKNQMKLSINPALELLISLELDFLDKKRILLEIDAKVRNLEKENNRISEEKHAYKSQLGLLIKPFNRKFDADEFYKFDKIQLKTPKSLRIFDSEEKNEISSRKKPENTQEFVIKQDFGERTFKGKEGRIVEEPKEQDSEERNARTFSLDAFKYDDNLTKSSMQRKIEQIIKVNREEKEEIHIEKTEEIAVWRRFLIRSDIIGIFFVLAAVLLNSQRNLFLDVKKKP